jgi:hypothetical protein
MSHGLKSGLLLGVAAAAALLASSGPALAHPSPFTLDQVMSAPLPSDLTASKTDAVAWVFSARGVRNVWIAVAGRKAAPVTSFTEDKFQIDNLAWSDDGGSIAFTRGQSIEDAKPATELIRDLRAHKIPHDELVIPNEIHDMAL